MSFALRLLGCVCLLALPVVAACALCPALLSDLGLDVWEWPEAQVALVAEETRQQELDERFQGILRRHEGRNRIGHELIAGRISLAEAVRQTGELGGSPENLRWHLEKAMPAVPPEERMYRYVIDGTCDLVRDDAARAGAVRARLEAELRAAPRDAAVGQ